MSERAVGSAIWVPSVTNESNETDSFDARKSGRAYSPLSSAENRREGMWKRAYSGDEDSLELSIMENLAEDEVLSDDMLIDLVVFASGSLMIGGIRSKSESKSSKLFVAKKPTKAPAMKKVVKDPTKPKRHASDFFVFIEEFREQYKKEHDKNNSVAIVGKAVGDKWKSLSNSEKDPYQAKAEKSKVEYEKNMKAYNKKQAEAPTEEEDEASEKSVSEVKDDEDTDEGSEEDEDDE